MQRLTVKLKNGFTREELKNGFTFLNTKGNKMEKIIRRNFNIMIMDHNMLIYEVRGNEIHDALREAYEAGRADAQKDSVLQ